MKKLTSQFIDDIMNIQKKIGEGKQHAQALHNLSNKHFSCGADRTFSPVLLLYLLTKAYYFNIIKLRKGQKWTY